MVDEKSAVRLTFCERCLGVDNPLTMQGLQVFARVAPEVAAGVEVLGLENTTIEEAGWEDSLVAAVLQSFSSLRSLRLPLAEGAHADPQNQPPHDHDHV